MGKFIFINHLPFLPLFLTGSSPVVYNENFGLKGGRIKVRDFFGRQRKITYKIGGRSIFDQQVAYTTGS